MRCAKCGREIRRTDKRAVIVPGSIASAGMLGPYHRECGRDAARNLLVYGMPVAVLLAVIVVAFVASHYGG